MFDNPRKLVPNNQRRFQLGVANPGVQIGVEITPANTGGLNANENVPSAGSRRCSNFFNAQVARAMESGG